MFEAERARAKETWPDAKPEDIIWIAPIGSRNDVLLFWRAEQRVSTGRVGDRACFEGSLDAFEKAVEETYAAKIAGSTTSRPFVERQREDYRAAAAFLRAISERS